jgi:isochorismate pyruvate lyase
MTNFKNMEEVRAAIDVIDRMMVALLAERMRCISAAADLKHAPDQVVVPWRITDVVDKVRAQAIAVGFDADLAENIWRHMIDRSIAHERTMIAMRAEGEGS